MSTVASAVPIALPRIEHLLLDAIKADPAQVRKEFHVEHLQELADSIKAKGVVQPIVVRPSSTPGKFDLIAGERRLRASKLAGLTSIPSVVRSDLQASDVPVLQLVENLQRADLTLAEIAAGVAALCKTKTQDEAAKLLGKSKSWISKHAACAELPVAVKALVQAGKIGDPEIALGATELLAVDAGAGQQLLEDIKQPKSWGEPVTRDSVRESVKQAKQQAKWEEERAAREKAEAARKANAKPDPQLAKWEAERAKEETRRKGRRAKIRAIEKSCDELIRGTLPKLAAVFGKKTKMKGNAIASYYEQEIYIRPALQALEFGREAIPEHTDAVDFEVVFKVSGKDVVKLLGKLGIEAKGAAAATEAVKSAPAAAKVAVAKKKRK